MQARTVKGMTALRDEAEHIVPRFFEFAFRIEAYGAVTFRILVSSENSVAQEAQLFGENDAASFALFARDNLFHDRLVFVLNNAANAHHRVQGGASCR